MSLLQKPKPKKPNFEPATQGDQVKGQIKEFFWETIKVIIISLVIIIPVRYFLIQPFYVKGASMEPNFYDHEYLIIDEISYRLDKPQRGDVVVFRPPNNPSQFYIKRIIGLPGETIKIEQGKIIIINPENPQGFQLSEQIYLPNTQTQGSQQVTLGPDQYYLLGDNRSSSLDSRIFGPVKKDNIIGRVWIRGWPFSRITVFNDQSY